MDKVKQSIDKMIATGVTNISENIDAMYNLNLITIEQYEELDRFLYDVLK